MSLPIKIEPCDELRVWEADPGRQAAVRRTAQALGFREVYPLPAAKIVIANWVGLKCRYGCANYGTSWCCPPATPDPQTMQALLSEYELALLLVSENRNEQFYRNSAEKRRRQVKQWKATVRLERELFLMGYYKAFGLPSESCALCKKCAYPRPCKFPNEKRPSLEACSIDVFRTIQHLGITGRLAHGVGDTYNSYSLVMLF
jgi:predicted metal-binding protein